MSAASDCCAVCETPAVINVPGPEGPQGEPCTPCSDGVSAFTLTTEAEDVASIGASVVFSVALNTAFAIGQVIFISDGTDFGTFRITGKTGSTVITATKLDAGGDTATPFNLASGSIVTAAGAPGTLSAALPNAFTDNSGGTASDSIAVGVGVYTLVHPLSSLATGLGVLAIDLLTGLTIGHRFSILSFDFVTTIVGAGAGASQVFNIEIGSTDLTGGVLTVDLASTNTIGEISAGTAITANNVGTAGGTISIEMAAGGTVFSSGAGYFVIRVKNLDSADAFASLSDHVNDLITALS